MRAVLEGIDKSPSAGRLCLLRMRSNKWLRRLLQQQTSRCSYAVTSPSIGLIFPFPKLLRGEGLCLLKPDIPTGDFRPGTKRAGLRGGAWLTAEMFKCVLGDPAKVTGPPSWQLSKLGPKVCVQSYLRADRFIIDRTKKDSEESAGDSRNIAASTGRPFSTRSSNRSMETRL